MLRFECECGNKTSFFATSDYDEHGREVLDLEDDDCVSYEIGEASVMFKCKFCGHRYLLPSFVEFK